MKLLTKCSIVVRLKNAEMTLEEILADLQQDVPGLKLINKCFYERCHFISSLGANLFIIPNEFRRLQETVVNRPYFEKIIF